jgi:hypothetical protein
MEQNKNQAKNQKHKAKFMVPRPGFEPGTSRFPQAVAFSHVATAADYSLTRGFRPRAL